MFILLDHCTGFDQLSGPQLAEQWQMLTMNDLSSLPRKIKVKSTYATS